MENNIVLEETQMSYTLKNPSTHCRYCFEILLTKLCPMKKPENPKLFFGIFLELQYIYFKLDKYILKIIYVLY